MKRYWRYCGVHTALAGYEYHLWHSSDNRWAMTEVHCYALLTLGAGSVDSRGESYSL